MESVNVEGSPTVETRVGCIYWKDSMRHEENCLAFNLSCIGCTWTQEEYTWTLRVWLHDWWKVQHMAYRDKFKPFNEL